MLHCKQVICVRDDLKMSRGKMAAQVAHGALGAYDAARISHMRWISEWKSTGQTKICLSLVDEKDMDAVLMAVILAKLPYGVIADAGLTQVAPGTRTVLAIGPAPVELIDAITGPTGLHPLRLA
jgi:PTH2 family peptidyl-tRNA hydrolase